MQIGDNVTITEGPLLGLVGRLAGLSEQRVLIIVQMGGHAVDVEMDLDWVAVTAPQRKSVTRVGESAHEVLRSDQA